MEIKQLKAYQFVSVVTTLVCALAFQDFFQNESIFISTVIVGALGTMLLGLAAIAVVLRYVISLFSQFSEIGFKRFSFGLFLLIMSTLAWFMALAKFAIAPMTTGALDFETQLPAMLGLINGLSGIVYFYILWPLQKSCLTSHGS